MGRRIAYAPTYVGWYALSARSPMKAGSAMRDTFLFLVAILALAWFASRRFAFRVVAAGFALGYVAPWYVTLSAVAGATVAGIIWHDSQVNPA